MRIYVKVQANGIITDAVSYPYADYVPLDVDLPFPDGLYAGWYRLIDSKPVFDQELYDEAHRAIPESPTLGPI